MEIRQLSKFDATVTSVFNSLLENFPTPNSLDATVAGYEANGGYKPIAGSTYNEKTYTRPSEDERFFADTIRWLASEKYLAFKKEEDCKFEDVVATEKGLKLWTALPDSLS